MARDECGAFSGWTKGVASSKFMTSDRFLQSFSWLSLESPMQKSPLPTDQYVGNRVRMRRLMLGLSQTELATAVGVTFQQVQKYEKGKNRISASRLQQISNVLRVPIPFFFERRRKNGKKSEAIVVAPNKIDALLATKSGLALAKAFTQIKEPKLRRTIVSMVEEVAASEG